MLRPQNLSKEFFIYGFVLEISNFKGSQRIYGNRKFDAKNNSTDVFRVSVLYTVAYGVMVLWQTGDFARAAC